MYGRQRKIKAEMVWRNEPNHELYQRLPSPSRVNPGRLGLVLLFLILISNCHPTLASSPSQPQVFAHDQSMTSKIVNGTAPLECLQVKAPVENPTEGCQQILMVHTFAESYGKPFIGEYKPPSCDFNRVTFNLTIQSAGRQFDRLALMFLGDTEIFRTSTAEPTRDGIYWSYVKDMSNFLSMFKDPQKIIFDLGNLVDDTYTGLWNTTLTANFFVAEDLDPADVIVPISAQRSSQNMPSAFVVPETTASSTVTLPRNAKKAVFSISACGQAAEEFWWSNVLTSDTDTWANETTLYGESPWREVQLYIDGYLAGVSWPFQIIFTGGVVPGFWRPIVGIDAFDLQEDEIDITPFIPLLSDGEPHTFEIRVVGIIDDELGSGKVTDQLNSNWVVTGKVFMWLDSNSTLTTGTIPNITAPDPEIFAASVGSPVDTHTDSLTYRISTSRNLYVESHVNTSSGSQVVFWNQKLKFTLSSTLRDRGNTQSLSHDITGSHQSSSQYERTFEYPLWVISTFDAPSQGNLSIEASMGRGKYVQQIGRLAYPHEASTSDYTRSPLTGAESPADFIGAKVNNWQNGSASYLSVPAQKRSYGSGSTEQLYSLTGIREGSTTMVQDGTNGAGATRVAQQSQELYRRRIVAANDSIVYDDEVFAGQVRGQNRQAAPRTDSPMEFAINYAARILGRGPK